MTLREVIQILERIAMTHGDAIDVVFDCPYCNRSFAPSYMTALIAPVTAAHGRDQIGYAGPVKPGMYFIWGADNPRAWTLVLVTAVVVGRFDEALVFTLDVRNPTARAYRHHIESGLNIVWNEMGRFREMVTPCDENGVITAAAPPHADVPPAQKLGE